MWPTVAAALTSLNFIRHRCLTGQLLGLLGGPIFQFFLVFYLRTDYSSALSTEGAWDGKDLVAAMGNFVMAHAHVLAK